MTDTANKRIDWIDIAKGLGMLSVIIAHTMAKGLPEDICGSCIYSFHMPLFLILSALTCRLSADSGQFLGRTERAFKRLIGAALLVFAVRIGIQILQAHDINWTAFLARRINALIYASCDAVHVQKAKILGIGFIWFFFTLFTGRTLFDYLHLKLKEEKRLMTAAAVCAVFGLLVGRIQVLPLTLDIALVSMPFLYFGYRLKDWNLPESCRKTAVISSIIWIIGLYMSYLWAGTANSFTLDLASRRYNLFPVFYINAIAGTLVVCCLSIFISRRFYNMSKPLLFIGKNSIYLFCIHSLDYSYSFLWELTDSYFCNFWIRLALDLLPVVILTRLTELINNRKKQIIRRSSRPAASPPEYFRQLSPQKKQA